MNPYEDRYDSEIHINLGNHIDSFEPEPDPTDYSSLRNTLPLEARRWRVFRKQSDALQCAKLWAHIGVMPFSYHHCSCSRRYFLATHPLELWHRNRHRPHSYNYEIIAEGSYSKLYLDLEFDRELNTSHDGVRMTDTVNKILLYILNKDFNLKLDFTHILNLDSTTNKKFSRHIIVQIPIPVLFHSNIEVGVTVGKVCDLIRSALQGNSDWETIAGLGVTRAELEELQVQDKMNKINLFIDQGVYTKNRHFRLFGSSKFGRAAPLVISPENRFTSPFSNDDLTNEYFLLSSLITYTANIEYVVPILTIPSKPKVPFFPPLLTSKTSTSPFPPLDSFVRKLMHPCNIDKVLNFNKGEVFVFVSREAGYCSNVQRQHTKSRVVYVIEALHGLYHQKCHHPNCRNFRSKSASLPLSVKLAIGIPSDEWDQEITSVFSSTFFKQQE